MNKILPTLLLPLMLIGCAASARAQSLPYKVGIAKQIITPCTANLEAANACDKGTGYIDLDADSVDLLGAGAHDTAGGIHSQLWVRALAIEDQATGRQIVMVSVDVAVFTRSFIEEVRDEVRGYAGLRPDEVMINASHTHSAPSLKAYCPGPTCPEPDYSGEDNAPPDPQYVAGVKARIVNAIKAAMDDLTPASLYFGTGTSLIGKYRRLDHAQHAQPNQFCIPPAVPSENVAYPQRLDVLEARNSAGQVLATAFFVGTHPVNMMNGLTVSSDFVGPARERVEGQLQGSGSTAATAFFFQGFGGDLNPRRWNFEPGNTTTNAETGEELGDDVLRVRATMTTPLSGAMQVSSQVQYLGLDPANAPWDNNASPFLPTEVQTLRLGAGANGWTLVAVEHEVVSEYANYFRNAWPDPARVTLAGYSNGVESYLPNERIIKYDRVGDSSSLHFEGYYAIRAYGLGWPNWMNGDLLSRQRGASGGAHSLSLNGTGAYARVPYGPGLGVTGPLTIEAWIKVNSHGADKGIAERYGPYNSASGGYDLRVTAAGKLHFFIGYDTSNPATYHYIRGATTISTGVWHHVAGVYDGAQMRVYLDGALDGSEATSVTPGAGTSDLIIGARGNDAAALFFNGGIDELRITSGALYASNFTPRAQLESAPGTVGLWKFNGQTGGDSSVEGNDAVPAGGATYSAGVPREAAGTGDNSLALAFPTSYVDVPDSASLDVSGPLTLEAWVKPNASGRAQSIVERYGPTQSTTDGGYDIRILPNGHLSFFIGYDNDTPGSHDVLEGSTVVTPGLWHHVAGVYDGSQMRVYLDGVLDASKSTSVVPGTGSSHLLIGVRGNDAADGNFNGLIDEVRLTAGAVYTSGFTPAAQLTASSGTRGLWKFDGLSTLDSSANGNDGTLVGGAGHSADVPANAAANHSLSLNGTRQRVVSVPDAASLDVVGPLTLEAWVRVNSNNTQQGIIERYGPYQSTTDGGYDLRIRPDGKLSFFIGYDTSNNPATFDVLVGNTTVTANAWHHVAGVYDGYEMRVYVDGVLDGSKATTSAPGVGSSALIIGARGNDAAAGFLNGLIDEARVTAGAAYTCSFTPTQRLTRLPGTRGLWKFDGQTLQDSSGFNNHGAPVDSQGAAAYSTTVP